MNIYDKIAVLEVSDNEISSEIESYKALASDLNVDVSNVIRTRNALELERLREVLVNVCIFQHKQSHLTEIARSLDELCGK